MNKPFALFLCAAFLLGGGCSKKTNVTAPSLAASNAPLVWLPTSTGPVADAKETTRNELNEALRAFQNVKSFRAKYILTQGGASLTTSVEVQKPDRLHGTLTSTKTTAPTEVVGIGAMMYVKLADGTWTTVENKDDAYQLRRTMSAALQVSGSETVVSVPDTVVVTKREDAIRACTMYRATLTAASSPDVTLDVCVTDGLPKTIAAQSTDGSISTEYRDYNEVFTIERPTLPRKPIK